MSQPRTGSVNLSTVAFGGRLDAEFVLAMQEHQAKVEALVKAWPRIENLREWVQALPFSPGAWRVIQRGSDLTPIKLPEKALPRFNEKELALYLILAAADDKARQKASDDLERAARAVRAHADMRKELEALG